MMRQRSTRRATRRIVASAIALALTLGGGLAVASTATTANASGTSAFVDGSFGSGRQAVASLYTLTGGAVTSSIPFASDLVASTSFDFGPLDSGDYGLAFRDPDTGLWIQGNGSCLTTFSVADGAIQDVNLGTVTLGNASDALCLPPWGFANTFSGHITNLPSSAKVEADLIYGSGADVTPVNSSFVSSNGDFSVNGVSNAGTYFVLLRILDNSPFLDTWSDGSDADAPFVEPVNAETPTNGASITVPDLALLGAATLSGTVRGAHSAGLKDASVVAQTDDGSFENEAITDAHGAFTLRVLPGATLQLDATANGYDDVFWNGVLNPNQSTPVVAPATAIPSLNSYNFQLTPLPTQVGGLAIGVDNLNSQNPVPLTGLKAELYKKLGGYWKKISVQIGLTDSNDPYVYFDFTQREISALSSGDFRLQFYLPGTGFLPIAQYESASYAQVTAGVTPVPVVGPVCFIPLTGVTSGDEWEVITQFDFSDTTTQCKDQRQPPISTSSVVVSTTPTSVPKNLTLTLPTSTSTSTPTPAPTPSVTSAPAPSPSTTTGIGLAPSSTASSGGFPGWLIWVIGAVILVVVIGGGVLLFIRRSA